MKLPGIHLKSSKHRGKRNLLLQAAMAPLIGEPAFEPSPPTMKPAHGGTPMIVGGTDNGGNPSWVVSGGTSLPYLTPPGVVQTYVPPYRYTIPSPISPLLALGYGLNLAMLAAELLGVQGPGDAETYPGTDIEVVY